MRRSADERLRTAADCLSRFGVSDRTQCRYCLKGTTLGTNPKPLFEDGPGPGLEPVGGEFQPSFETGYPGGGAYLIFVLKGWVSWAAHSHFPGDTLMPRSIRNDCLDHVIVLNTSAI